MQKMWDEKNCTPQQVKERKSTTPWLILTRLQQQEGEEEDMDTPTTSTDCCGRDCAKVQFSILDITYSVVAKLNFVKGLL